MTRDVLVPCTKGDEEITLPVTYTIEIQGDVQVIACSLTHSAQIPNWLQVRKFELRSIIEGGGYTPLYTYQENIKNMETLVFIEKTYELVMVKEKFKVLV